MRAWCVLGAVVLSGCNAVFGLDQTGYRHDAAPIDAPGCSGGVFGAPSLVTDYDFAPFEPQLGPDLLEAWFIRLGSPTQVYQATRASTTALFGAPTLASFSQDLTTSPALTGDGLRMLFVSSRVGGNAVYEVTRPSLGAAFGAPVAVPGLADYTLDSLDVSFDGRTAYFSHRDNDVISTYAATRPSLGEPFGPATLVATDAGYAGVSPDELELFSNPTVAPWPLRQHVRASPRDPFATIDRILLDMAEDPDLAPDGRTLIVSIGNNLAVLERPCP